MRWDDERCIGGLGRGPARNTYLEGENPENIFNAEARATCLVEHNSDCTIRAVAA